MLLLVLSAGVPSLAQSDTTRVFLDDVPLLLSEPPVTSGGVISLPLEPIARATGAAVTVDTINHTITAVRSKDQSTFLYNTITGESTVNDVPRPVMPSPIPISISTPSEIFLPVEIMAVVLNLSIEPRGNTISIYRDSGSRASPTMIRPSGGWKDFGLDFFRYDLQEQTFTPRPLPGNPTTANSAIGSPPIASPVFRSPIIASASAANSTIYSRSALLGGGAHWGSYDIDGASTLVGGTLTKNAEKFSPLTYSSAFLNAVNVSNGWRFFGGDNFLKGFHDDRLINGYPVLGISAIIPINRRWTVSKFLGAGFTTAIPTGGGTSRFSYRRLLSISEVAYSPNRHLTTSIAAIGFRDLDRVKFKTKEYGAYVESYTTWRSRTTEASALVALGTSNTAPTLKGGSSALDLRGRRKINQYLTAYSAFDRYSQNFTNPQITSNYFNRQDSLLGLNVNLHNRIGYGVSGSDNLTNLQFARPDRSDSLTMSAVLAPFEAGPQINVTGVQTVQTKGIIHSTDIVPLNQRPSKFALESIGLSQKILGTQFFANLVSITQTAETGKKTNIATINLNASRDIPRIGRVNVSTVLSNQRLFQITALFTTRPLYRRTVLIYGPGYSSNGISSRFTLILGISGRPPLIGNFVANNASLLPQTVSTAHLDKIIWLNKNHRAPSGLVGLPNQLPQGSASGFVVQSSDFPVALVKELSKIGEISVILDDHVERPSITGKNGEFHFEHVSPGTHKISLDLSSIPANLAVTSPDSFYMRISPYKDTPVNFSLSPMGQIEGTLTAGSGMGLLDLANTRVYLVGKKGLETISNLDGTYRITDIPAGTYTVKVDTTGLGPAIEATPVEQKIVVTALKTLTVANFVVGRKVEIKQF